MEATNTSRAASEARFLECQCGEDGGGKKGEGEGRDGEEDIVSVPVWRPRIQAELHQKRDSLSVNVGRTEEVREGRRG